MGKEPKNSEFEPYSLGSESPDLTLTSGRSPEDLLWIDDGEAGAQLAEYLAELLAPSDVVALLDRLGDRVDAPPIFARAARALRHTVAGRPPTDDAAALAEARALFAAGETPTLNAALRLVAKVRVERPRRRAMFERLRRKAKKVCTK